MNATVWAPDESAYPLTTATDLEVKTTRKAKTTCWDSSSMDRCNPLILGKPSQLTINGECPHKMESFHPANIG